MRETSPRWLWLAFAGAGLLYAVPSVLLLQAFIQQAYDVGIFDQTLWLIAHGESFNTVAGYHVMADHFSPVLYVISPLAYIPGGAAPELVFQSLFIATGVFPVYKLAKHLNRDPRLLVMIYAIHPAMITGSWTGWRPWNLAVPAFMWACYWIVSRPSMVRVIVSGLILLTFREDIALWVGLLAVILFLDRRFDLKGLIVSGLALGAATWLVLFVALPALSPTGEYFFAGDFTGGNPDAGQIVSSISVRVVFLLLPLAIAPARLNWKLLAPLVLPVVGLVMRGGPSLTTAFQYDMMFVPLLVVIVGLSEPVLFRPLRLAAASLITLVAFGALRPIEPLNGPNPFRYDAALATDYRAVLAELQGMDDFESLSVTAPDTLVPHLSERSRIFVYPWPVDVIPDPENIDSRLSFDCPPPEVLVERPEFITERWQDVMDGVPYRTDHEFDLVTMWRAETPIPPGTCQSQYARE